MKRGWKWNGTLLSAVLAVSIFSLGCGDQKMQTAEIIAIPSRSMISFSWTIEEDLRISDVFQDGMVFQSGEPFCIYGTGKPGNSVEIVLRCEDQILRKASGNVAEDGSFLAEFPGVEPSVRAHELQIRCGEEERTFRDILFGEVILASGQSNMRLTVGEMKDGIEYAAEHGNPYVRFYTSPNLSLGSADAAHPDQPQLFGTQGGWGSADQTDRLLSCSAIGFVTATELFAHLNQDRLAVPVAILDASTGGTSVDAWLPGKRIEEDETLKSLLIYAKEYISEINWNRQGMQNFDQMTAQFNLKIAPLSLFHANTLLWLQGENNVPDVSHDCYETATEAVFSEYERIFSGTQSAFSVALIHPAPFAYETDPSKLPDLWTRLDAIWKRNSDRYVQIPVYDLPLDYTDAAIHPYEKIPVGRRTADALWNLRQKQDGWSAPSLLRAERAGEDLLLTLQQTGGGVTVVNGSSSGFEIEKQDGTRIPVSVKAEGDDQLRIVSIPEGAVRILYQFHQLADDGRVVGATGIPLAPFREEIL